MQLSTHPASPLLITPGNKKIYIYLYIYIYTNIICLEIKNIWATRLAGAIQIQTVSTSEEDLSLEVKMNSKKREKK